MKGPRFELPVILPIVIIVLFIFLSIISAFVPYFNLDLSIADNLQSINSINFQKFMWFNSSIGNQPFILVIIGITSIFLYINKQKREAIIIPLSSAGGALLGSLVKIIVNRPRPEDDLVRVSVWLSDKSYPSGHVLVFTVFFGFLLYLLIYKSKHKKRWIPLDILLILLISTIGISRIYLGVHWPSDVLGGYLLGSLWLIFTIWIYNSPNGKR